MASRDLTYTIGVDASDASAGLRKLEGAVRSTMRTVEDELDEGASAGDKLAASLDRVASQTKEDLNSAAIAAEELQRALRDAGSGLDVGDALTSLQRMGLSFDEITQDADRLAVSLKGLGDVRAEGVKELDAIAPGLATKLDNVEKSAGSSRSALANMVGNTSQSMGELAGVTGDLGVGIGQIGEYFADAALEGEGLASVVKSFAGVAGPMAALAAATALVSSVMSSRARASEAEEAQVEGLTEAYRSGVDPAKAYADALRDIGTVTVGLGRNAAMSEQGGILGFVGSLSEKLGALGLPLQAYGDALGIWGEATADLAPLLAKAGISVDVWSQAVLGGHGAVTDMAAALAETNLSAEDQKTVLDGLTDSQKSATEARTNATAITKVFGAEEDKATKSTEELARAQEEAKRAAADQAIAVAGAADSLRDVTSASAEAERRAGALAAAFDLGDATAEWATGVRDIAEGIAGLGAAAEGVDLSDALDPTNLGADKLLDALDSLRPQIQEKISTAFTEGGPQAATAAADQYVNSIVEALGGKLSPDKVRELLGIGDLTTTLQVAVDQSSVARAKSELEVLVGVGGETPFTASLKLAVDSGQLSGEAARAIAEWGLVEEGVQVPLDAVTDPVALAEAQAFMASFAAANPATVPLNADPTQAAKDAQGFASGDQPTGTIPLDADPTQADKEAQGVKTKAEGLNPVVAVDANTQAAIATMVLLKVLAQLLAPTVKVEADTAPARQAINDVAAMRPRVPVVAYVSDYPTAGEIQSMIGRPRIPVDIVVGQSIRITGVRE